MKPRHLDSAVFLISGTGIAYQVILMRIFSIAQWHHFAYMMISIAMLGFAAGGIVLTLLYRWSAGKEASLLRKFSFILTLSLVLCYAVSQALPFETYQLATQPIQLLYLSLLYLILALPFFFTSCCILLAFYLERGHVGRIYAVNMIGSGAGALVVVLLMFLVQPAAIPYCLTFMAALATLLLFIDGPYPGIQTLFLLTALFCVGIVVGFQPIRISEYKGLAYALRMPDAKIRAEAQSPLSVLTAVESAMIRETPGQISHRFKAKKDAILPDQIGLFFDADSVSVINRWEQNPQEPAYLDYVTTALPYHLLDKPDTLIIGAGGGTDVLSALLHGAEKVTAVEVDPRVFPIMKRHFQVFSGRLWDHPSVEPIQAEGRAFLQSSRRAYDLIQIPLLDAFNASSAGVYALNESYLYTKEAIQLYLQRLTPGGILAVTRWLKTPPRDAIKMAATLIEAAPDAGIENPAAHMAMIRSWNTATLIASRSPLSPLQVEKIRRFAAEREFDLVYLPGIRPDEVNRYTILEQPVYYEAVTAMLSDKRKDYYRRYLYYIEPATDDRPYFFRFFKWGSINRLIQGMGSEWIPFVEWGYITLLATLIQAMAASCVLIVLPLVALARSALSHKKYPTIPILMFFFALGLAYIFLEIAFMQKYMLFLAYPIYAIAVVLTSFLLFSGFGSYFADRFRGKREALIVRSVILIAVLSLAYMVSLPVLFQAASGWGDAAKILMCLILLAPIAFCMGIPFPTGFQKVTSDFEACAPWAWGINGCASVVGASLATLIAVHAGFRIVVLSACLLYFLAAACYFRMIRSSVSRL